MSSRLTGKIVVVTGAASGLGRAIVARFVTEGAMVVAGDVVNPDRAVPQGAPPGSVLPVPCDVTDLDATTALIERCRQEHGRLDVVVNSAGVSQRQPVRLHELDPADWERVISINLRGVFYVLRAAIPLMIASGGGSIVNIASIASLIASPRSSSYDASKGGVLMLTKNSALEYVDDNIRVNAICPGPILTEMVSPAPEKLKQALARSVPMNRLGRPDEVANLALFLASDESSYITGQGYVIDGGHTAR